jgi:hypothetical protein
LSILPNFGKPEVRLTSKYNISGAREKIRRSGRLINNYSSAVKANEMGAGALKAAVSIFLDRCNHREM